MTKGKEIQVIAEDKTWFEAVEVVTPYVVGIRTPRGSGTGFLFHRPSDGDIVVLATAAHVIEHAHAWEEPLRLVHAKSEGTVLLRPADRAVFIDEDKDTAALVFPSNKLASLPKETLGLAPEKKFLKVGNAIGWLGFPGVVSSLLCFFRGHVSAWDSRNSMYLVDGIAINGVSGGPAFHLTPDKPMLMGVLSAYIPNRQPTGEALPGLAVVRDVSHLHEVVKHLQSLDKAQEEQSPPEETTAPPVDPSPPPPPSRRRDTSPPAGQDPKQ